MARIVLGVVNGTRRARFSLDLQRDADLAVLLERMGLRGSLLLDAGIRPGAEIRPRERDSRDPRPVSVIREIRVP